MNEESFFTRMLKKYGESNPCLGTFSYNDIKYLVLKMGADYVLVTSESPEGKEYSLKLETFDKVRDICCGNIRSLTDDELEVLENFSYKGFLELMTRESTNRFIEDNYGKRPGAETYLLGTPFDHDFWSSTSFEEDAKEKATKQVAEFTKNLFGIDIEKDMKGRIGHEDDVFVKILSITASDCSFEREEFLRRIRYKKKEEKK